MPNRRPTRARKGKRRRQWLEHALTLIARQGFAATTLEQIAEAAGIAPSTLARSFKNKSEVVRGIAEEFAERVLVVSADLPEPLAKLNVFVESFRKEMRLPASPSRVLLELLAEAPAEVIPAISEPLEPGVTNLAGLIQIGQQEGVFRRSLDPRHTAWELLRSLFGLALLDGLEPAPLTDPDHPPVALECLLQGLLKTDV
jgi:AcrR family transcriptional regulator